MSKHAVIAPTWWNDKLATPHRCALVSHFFCGGALQL
jgi:hypothetical protein